MNIKIKNLVGDQLDPWWYVRDDGGFVAIQTPTSNAYYLGGMLIGYEDRQLFFESLKLVHGRDKHDVEHDAYRRKAGMILLKINDNMVRARALDYVDGWSAILLEDNLIEATEEGALYKSPDIGTYSCNFLQVKCPSTFKKYVLKTPADIKTVAEARKWVMRGVIPEVET